MTGAYLRVERNGEWHNIEVEHLTSAERAEMFKDRQNDELLRWLDCVCEALAQVDDIIKRGESDDE